MRSTVDRATARVEGRGGDVVLQRTASGDRGRGRIGPARRLRLRGGHGRVPGRGGLQRAGPAGQQLAGLGAGRQGGALGHRRGLLGASRGVARPCRRPGVQQLPPGRRVGPGLSRRRQGRRRRPGLVRGRRAGMPRPRHGAAGDAPPLHPPGLAGRGPLVAARRPGTLPGLGRGGRRGTGSLGALVGHRQRDQRVGHRLVAARHVPARAVPGLRGRGHRHRPSADGPRAGLRGHPPGTARRRGDHQQQLHECLRLRSPADRRAPGPERRGRPEPGGRLAGRAGAGARHPGPSLGGARADGPAVGCRHRALRASPPRSWRRGARPDRPGAPSPAGAAPGGRLGL